MWPLRLIPHLALMSKLGTGNKRRGVFFRILFREHTIVWAIITEAAVRNIQTFCSLLNWFATLLLCDYFKIW